MKSPKTNKSLRKVKGWIALSKNKMMSRVYFNKSIAIAEEGYGCHYLPTHVIPCTITYSIPKPIKRKN